jgi:hypothetical protein
MHNACVMGDSEANHCRLIAEKMVDILKGYECNVWLVPQVEGDEVTTLQKVVNSSNYFVKSNPADMSYHLDIHTDGGYAGSGSSGFYMSEGGKAFIQKIHKEISLITPWADGLVSQRNLVVLRETMAVAGLIEISFHDRLNEAKWIHDNLDLIANSAVKGIIKAADISLKPVIVDLDYALKILSDNEIINDVVYRKKVCDIIPFEKEFVINIANYIIKTKPKI